MDKKWKITFNDKIKDGLLSVNFNYDDFNLSNYILKSNKDVENSKNECIKKFMIYIRKGDSDESNDDKGANEIKDYIWNEISATFDKTVRDNVEINSNDDDVNDDDDNNCVNDVNDDDDDGDVKNNTKSIIQDIFNNDCMFAVHNLDVCFEKISRGAKYLEPGRDHVPKNISFCNKQYVSYYSRIEKISIIESLETSKTQYWTDKTDVVVEFKMTDMKYSLVFALGYIGKSNDENKSLGYYKWKEFKEKSVITENLSYLPIISYNFENKKYDIGDASKLAKELTPAMNYYRYQLDNFGFRDKNTKLTVNLKLLRENYEIFESLAVGNDLIALPICEKCKRINGITICTEYDDNHTETHNFFEASLLTLSKEAYEDDLEILKNNGIKLSKDSSICILDLLGLSEREAILLKKVITDGSIKSCTIEKNIEGERTRLKRIISGIESIAVKKVINKSLINTISTNDIKSQIAKISDGEKYVPNEEYIAELKNCYPILSKNREQLVAIDKIIQMNNKDLDVMLIQGPPGTGKTELILALAQEFYKRKFRTLITSNVHVACDNIVDRLKNKKDLVLKRYTKANGEQYETEIEDNKINYIDNQVLAGFQTEGNWESITKDYYETLKGKNAKLIANLNQLNEKNEQNEKNEIYVHEYLDFILQKESLQKDISDEQEILSQKEKEKQPIYSSISSLVNEIELQKTNIKKLEDKNTKSQKIKSESDELVKQQEQKISEIYTFFGKATQENESLSERNSKYLADIILRENKIKDLQEDIQFLQKLKSQKTVLMSEVAYNFAFKNINYPNNYYKKILIKHIKNIQLLSSLYKEIEKDVKFWDGNKCLNFSSIEYIYFAYKKDASLKLFIDEKILSSIEAIYLYYKFSRIKRSMMSVFPVIKIKGYTNLDYKDLIETLSQEFKKLKFCVKDYISDYIEKYILVSEIDQEIELASKNIEANTSSIIIEKETISKNEKTINCNNQICENNDNENLNNKLILKSLREKQLESKAKLDESARPLMAVQKQLDENNAKHSDLVERYINVKKMIKESNDSIFNKKEELFNVESSIESILKDKKELIDEYYTLKNAKEVATVALEANKKNLDKIDQRANELIKNGWDESDAYSLIFNYIEELKAILDNNGKMKNYDKGKGVVFDKMFRLDNNDSGSLISMTTNQIASLLNDSNSKDLCFDYAIVDEASKCKFEDLVISLSCVKHLVLIGDFMQLDPVSQEYNNIDLNYKNMLNEAEWTALNKSPFSMLLAKFVEYNEKMDRDSFEYNPWIAVLKVQYRMNKGIFNIIEPIYSIHRGFELLDGKNKCSNDIKCININGSEQGMEGDTSVYNEAEKEAIVSFLKQFQNNRKDYPNIKTIGVITGYRAQENLLKKNLKSIKIPGLQIGTFDRFQGREYDLVIISLVRTLKFGFTNDIRRMNVAFSRAKTHLFIFGNIDALYKIASRTNVKFEEEENCNSNNKEKRFVVKNLIPGLYNIKTDYISSVERTDSLLGFIKESQNE